MSSGRSKYGHQSQSQDEGFCSMEPGPSHRQDEPSFVEPSQSQSVRRRSAPSRESFNIPDKYAGYIIGMKLINFMCHDNLEFQFNPKINFIIGRNGSGKSAIQTAISIALGAKAAATNRAASLKKLIKTGRHSASIEIVLSNRGERAYKQDVYGDKIIVSRTISESGSSAFRLKSARGSVISSKRDDLECLLSFLQVQIYNPVSILTQDTARTFFTSTNANKKYEIFLKGTQFDEMNNLIGDIVNCRRGIEDGIRIRLSEIETLENQLRELEEKAKMLEKVEQYQNQKEQLEFESLWARVHKCRTEIQEQESKLDSQTSQQEELQKLITSKSVKEEELKGKIEELKKVIDEQRSKIKEYHDAFQQKQECYRNVRRTHASKAHEAESLGRDLEKKKRDAATTEQEIIRLETQTTQNNEKLLEMKRKREQKEEELKTLNFTAQEAERERNVLRDTENNIKNQEMRVRDSVQQFRREIGGLNHQLSQLQSAGSTLNIYAPYMQELNARIDQACARGMFKKRPKGPLGQYIKVLDAEWGPAIERFIGESTLKSFIVDNGSDNGTLLKIMQQVCRGQRRPDIHCGKFTNRVYAQVYGKDVKYKQYTSLFKALEISDPDVANSLIDNKRIESVLLIDNNDLISHLMEKQERVPTNCSRSINKYADTYFPAPSYRQYDGLDSTKTHRSRFLQVSIDEARKTLEENIRTKNEMVAAEESKLRDLQRQLQNSRAQVGKWATMFDSYRRKIADLRRELNTDEETDDTEFRIPILKGELEALKTDAAQLEARFSQVSQETDELKNQLDSAKEEVQESQKNLQVGEDSEIARKLEGYQEELKEIQREVKRIASRATEATQRISFLQNRIEDCKKNEEAKRLEAERVCPEEIKETRDVETIEKDYKKVKRYIETVHSQMNASYLEVRREFVTKEIDFKKKKKSLDKLKLLCEEYRSLVKERRRIFSNKVDATSASVKINFQGVLKIRKYEGKMNIDHQNREIHLEIKPTDGSKSVHTTSLSGGERSYSAVAFILALWKVTDIPFYSMDEFDVFMDKVNRSFIIELLIKSAAEKNKSQYIFLTPQDCSSIKPSEGLSIFRMQDPERSSMEEN